VLSTWATSADISENFMTLVRVEVVKGNIQWNITQGKSGAWIGVCEPLKLTVQSDTWAGLMEDIGLTLNAVLKDLMISNELPQFLRDRGWQVIGAIPPRPEDVQFDVPFFPAMVNHGSQRELHQ
jgi:hypothetical protein